MTAEALPIERPSLVASLCSAASDAAVARVRARLPLHATLSSLEEADGLLRGLGLQPGSLDVLQFVGHGVPGRLQLRAAHDSSPTARIHLDPLCLAWLREITATWLRPDGVLRLVACAVGAVQQADVDGPLLALALRRATGRRTELTAEPVGAVHIDPSTGEPRGVPMLVADSATCVPELPSAAS